MPRLVRQREVVPFAERAKVALAVGLIVGACTFGFGLPLGAFGFGAAAVANAAVTSAFVGMLFSLTALLPRRRVIAYGHRPHTAPLFSTSVHHHPTSRSHVRHSVSHSPGLFSSWLGNTSNSSRTTHSQTHHTGSHSTVRAQAPSSTNHSVGSTQHHTGAHPVRHYKK